MNTPRISVILITVNDYQSLRKTIAHLRSQTIKEALEVVLVTTHSLKVDEDELCDFWGYQIVIVEVIPEVTAGLAAGVERARAPIVACGEDHAYPSPTWAEALLRAHEKPFAAVGVMMLNANPATAASRANFLLGFGQWMSPALAGEIDYLPGHNTSYKRGVLLQYGADLPRWMVSERALHNDLAAKGYQMFLTGEASVSHVNMSLIRSHLTHCFTGGRIFGAARSMGVAVGASGTA